jgi:pyrimidine operon attenuation protein/uracil phosphoribosyltransferase
MSSTRLTEKRLLADAAGVASALEELTSRLLPIVSSGNACLIGIQTGGAHLAKRLQGAFKARGLGDVPLGVLDITLYRDDTFLGLQQPVVRKTDISFELCGKDVILVDDVLYTGRTIRAALDALVDFGRPRLIRLAVLVDRGLREYPIQPDFAPLGTETVATETVQVELVEMGVDSDRVVVYERAS